jgi:hypothetical protein
MRADSAVEKLRVNLRDSQYLAADISGAGPRKEGGTVSERYLLTGAKEALSW